jgi:hypothetical protein
MPSNVYYLSSGMSIVIFATRSSTYILRKRPRASLCSAQNDQAVISASPKACAQFSAEVRSSQNLSRDKGSLRQIHRRSECILSGRLLQAEALDISCAVTTTPRIPRYPGRLRKSSSKPQSKSFLIFISFFPTPCASYQCNSAKRISPVSSSTYPEPFTLCQRLRRERDAGAWPL